MLLTGRPITAQRAFEVGLVNRVVPPADLDAAVRDYVDAILAASPLVVGIGKAAFYTESALDEEAAYAHAVGVMVDNALRRRSGGDGCFFAEAPAKLEGGVRRQRKKHAVVPIYFQELPRRRSCER